MLEGEAIAAFWASSLHRGTTKIVVVVVLIRSFSGRMAPPVGYCTRGPRFKSRRRLSYSEIYLSDFNTDFHRLGL